MLSLFSFSSFSSCFSGSSSSSGFSGSFDSSGSFGSFDSSDSFDSFYFPKSSSFSAVSFFFSYSCEPPSMFDWIYCSFSFT